MKIAVVSDVLVNSGGGLHMAMTAFLNFKKIKNAKLEIKFICTNKALHKKLKSELNLSSLLFDKQNLFNKISLKFNKLNFVKYINTKFSLNNLFESFLKKNDIDLVFFLSPSSLVLLCDSTNFVYTIWEFQHKFTPFFPEYKSNSIENKDNLNEFAIKKAYKLILGNNTDLSNFSQMYNVRTERLKTLMFPSYLTKLNKEITLNEFKEFNEFIDNKKYIFYPAQFWAHKNHQYIIDAFEKIKDKNLYCVFTGIDKGNLSFIKKYIHKKNIKDRFIIFNYLEDEKIKFLYKKCHAIIFPSYVGSHSFPLFEGFFYKKPVIYNKYTIDENLSDKIFKLDIEDINDLERILIDLDMNKNKTDIKIDSANKYFFEQFKESKIQNDIENILLGYEKFSKKWKC
tara:strand:- start:86 stop:1279 length:1194 start_codon:yes stop_codon:yes gene_type:complete